LSRFLLGRAAVSSSLPDKRIPARTLCTLSRPNASGRFLAGMARTHGSGPCPSSGLLHTASPSRCRCCRNGPPCTASTATHSQDLSHSNTSRAHTAAVSLHPRGSTSPQCSSGSLSHPWHPGTCHRHTPSTCLVHQWTCSFLWRTALRMSLPPRMRSLRGSGGSVRHSVVRSYSTTFQPRTALAPSCLLGKQSQEGRFWE
jgi:hypothetical protein